ncbi:hypothetical protein [Halovivax sp.]|uniref:hypothetical protein n=1 Tax=Halovivax sp. TaxID=1935978 RepID=UPI0031B80603
MELNRRSILSGIGAAGVSLTFAGYVGATEGEAAQFIVTTDDTGVADRVERAGFEVRRELGRGDVLQVVGAGGDREALESVSGVQQVARNARFGLEGPELEEFDAGEADRGKPAFWDIQWDKHVTDCAPAHELATGAGARIAVLDTGIDPTHPDLAANVN